MTTQIPVQRLSASARGAFLAHLLALDANDVRLRFGMVLPPDAIASYVARIDFDVDTLFGVHGDGLELEGAAHLAFGGDIAELGVSVLPSARGRGIGEALVTRAAEHARNRYVPRLFMHCLAENAAMIKIARHAGMDVVIEAGDADAHVTLPRATPLSVTSEMLADRVALYDYALKSNVEAWRRMGIALTEHSPK
ncbi:MAG: GNAT family N-acetyltransferase [Burkholderiales bacterium]